ncbi:HNH endonuclease [Marinobacter sp. Z-F4-2]|nr:HNH endonuclease [Marinobacter sp. Z-F4-2]
MFALRPQRTLFPNSGLCKPQSEKVCFVVIVKKLDPTPAPQLCEKAASSTSYARSAFGHGWDDADGDCQNSRAEALIETSNTTARFATDKECRVVTGRWLSPFTGKVIQNSSEIDIDHVVPLKWAWKRGAKIWAQAKRERFANDMLNLWPVELSLNRSKGDHGPDEWLPPSGKCGYVARFWRIVNQYDLQPSEPEARWITSFLHGCRS